MPLGSSREIPILFAKYMTFFANVVENRSPTLAKDGGSEHFRATHVVFVDGLG